MNWVPVQVEFFGPDQGGRTSPPRALYACTTLIGSETWSMVWIFASTPRRLRFLVDAAPVELLRPGLKLSLLEGRRAVGTVTVEAFDTYPSQLATSALPPPPPTRRSLEPEFGFLRGASVTEGVEHLWTILCRGATQDGEGPVARRAHGH